MQFLQPQVAVKVNQPGTLVAAGNQQPDAAAAVGSEIADFQGAWERRACCRKRKVTEIERAIFGHCLAVVAAHDRPFRLEGP